MPQDRRRQIAAALMTTGAGATSTGVGLMWTPAAGVAAFGVICILVSLLLGWS